jgi:hypothetical protein
MFFYNTYRWEWTTVLALHAPKPLLFANSDKDTIFPMDGNRRIMARLRTCYDMLGAKDNVAEHVSPGGHDYRPDLRIAIFSFINKHLKGDTGTVKDADFQKIEGKDLRVFQEDKDLPKDSINAKVDETFVPKAEVKLPAKQEEFTAWKAGMVKRLRETSLRGLEWDDEAQKKAGPGNAIYLDSQPEIDLVGDLLQRDRGTAFGDGSSTCIFLNRDEKVDDEWNYWDRRYPNATCLDLLFTRGGGKKRWTTKNPPNTIERSMALIGRTVDSGRVLDILERTDSKSCKYLRLVGKGEVGVLEAYAAIIQWSNVKRLGQRSGYEIKEVAILDPPTSHRDGPHFLGVNRVLDIPEALGLLAPDVKLTLVGKNAKDKAFDKTAEIYKLAGATDKFRRE